jgi:hypothetical protein
MIDGADVAMLAKAKRRSRVRLDCGRRLCVSSGERCGGSWSTILDEFPLTQGGGATRAIPGIYIIQDGSEMHDAFGG